MQHIYQACILILFTVLASGCSGGGGGGNGDPASNANLSSLVVNTADLEPAFSSGTLSYTASVANSVDSVTLTPTTQVDTSTVTVDGDPVASGSASQAIALIVGDTSVATVVTSENGNQQQYTVVITRLEPPSNNADLADLTLSVSELDQIFDSTVFDYTASAGFFGTATRIVATPEDSAASIEVNGEASPSAAESSPQALALGSNDLNVSVTAEDGTTTQSYDVTVTRAELSTAAQEAYIKASNPDPDNFGTSIAASGDILISGAPLESSAARGLNGDESDNSLEAAGAAYIFAQQGSTWTQRAYVKASNTDPGDAFGSSVALSRTAIAVGASGEQSRSSGINGVQTDNGGSNVGAVYLFESDAAGTLRQTNYVKASNPNSDDRFGGNTALADGVMAVAARFEQSAATGINGNQSDNSLANAGAVYVFIETSGVWQQAAYVKASNTDDGDEFGSAVAVTTDTLAAGAIGEDSQATGINGDEADNSAVDSGAVYLFAVNDGSLSQSAYVKASNTDTDDRFGRAVGIDADVLVIGAPGEDSAASGVNGDQSDNSLVDSGAAYVFERDNNGSWSQTAYLKASNPGLADAFGSSVSVRGNLIVVGATGEDSSSTGINGIETDESALNSGAAYVFERESSGNWVQTAYLKASNTDAEDRFGFALAIARDRVISSAPGEQSASAGINGDETDNSIDGAGAVYVLR